MRAVEGEHEIYEVCVCAALSASYTLNSHSHMYDWSNAKAQWVDAQPMDCEERLLTQAMFTKKANPSSHVFVHRNLVKALPLFTSVRVILDDPQYAGFLLLHLAVPFMLQSKMR